VRRISDCEICTQATGRQLGRSIASVACKRNADTFIVTGADDVITAI
jgi:hypothetical protein